ncbi:alpha/beta hydrolase [Citreimonas salinaria]|uniref:Phospholipase/carboxylesterase n=1 Tax=Citreimonas salinaria TaxID=321339 RepID=A0A1H3HSR6_9RHOB|nr:alpha/beta hydrolase [Citreimonas salinaria]SDY17749.1 phospholipase/carboxylesterase [Citreimonas salinaria]
MTELQNYTFAETKGEPGAPLVFTFHGTGGSERQFHDFPRQVLPGAHVISVRGDVSEMGALRYFRRKAEGIYDMEDLATRTTRMAGFIAAHKARVGADRVIGLGYSNGANIMASVAFRHPELFTDMALLHALIPWTPDPQPGLKGTRVLITAGQRDPICPAPQTQELIDWFDAQESEVSAQWHPGGHEIAQPEIDALARFMAG